MINAIIFFSAFLGVALVWYAIEKLRGGSTSTHINYIPPPTGDQPCVICGNVATQPWRKITATKSKLRIHGAAPTYSITDGEQYRLCDPHHRMIDSRLEQELSAARALIGETLTLIERRFAQLEMGELLTWAQVEAATATASIDELRNRELQPRQLSAGVTIPPRVVVLGEKDES